MKGKEALFCMIVIPVVMRHVIVEVEIEGGRERG
jgi:hypothetical protein